MKHSYLILTLLTLTVAAPTMAENAPAKAAPAAANAAAPAEETVADGNIAARDGEAKATDTTLRLRAKIAEIDKQYATLHKPSSSLNAAVRTVKSRADRELPNIDKMATEVAELQEKFNRAGAADYNFEIVSFDDRTKFARDGEAAYKAMCIDMKEKKSKRKVAGIDKFEILRDRYQGIPQYKQAYEWYQKDLKNLQKKWSAWLTKEQNARNRLMADKKAKRAKDDDAEYDKLKEQLEADGDKIAMVWYNPKQNNLRMLTECMHKVDDAIKRSEKTKLDDAVGTVPALLDNYWTAMDQARQAMVSGDLDGAKKILDEDPAFKVIKSLKSQLLPNEYREPLTAQRSDMLREIQKRQRDFRTLKQTLERKTAVLDRSVSGMEAQIENVMAKIGSEQDQDSGEDTMKPDDTPAPAEGAPADGAAPAEGNAPAEGAAPAEEAKAPAAA